MTVPHELCLHAMKINFASTLIELLEFKEYVTRGKAKFAEVGLRMGDY